MKDWLCFIAFERDSKEAPVNLLLPSLKFAMWKKKENEQKKKIINHLNPILLETCCPQKSQIHTLLTHHQYHMPLEIILHFFLKDGKKKCFVKLRSRISNILFFLNIFPIITQLSFSTFCISLTKILVSEWKKSEKKKT